MVLLSSPSGRRHTGRTVTRRHQACGVDGLQDDSNAVVFLADRPHHSLVVFDLF
jgi:hypothetical protein